MNKKMCVAGKIIPGKGTMRDIFDKKVEISVWLPDGCLGIMYAFESKKSARAYYKGIKDENIIVIRKS